MGVSWRTIVGGRQDDANVTRKTWAALEAAERRAGLHAAGEPEQVERRSYPLADNPYPVSNPVQVDALAQLQENMSELAASLAELTAEVKSLRVEMRATSRVQVEISGGRDASAEETLKAAEED